MLEYVGAGAGIPDVPARDLYFDDLLGHDAVALVNSGLYRVPRTDTVTDVNAVTLEVSDGFTG